MNGDGINNDMMALQIIDTLLSWVLGVPSSFCKNTSRTAVNFNSPNVFSCQ